jgi:RHS repeat-associated protein
VVAVLNSSRPIACYYAYDPFGVRSLALGDTLSALQFQARHLDAISGLYNFRARWYDPAVGRFISEDPIGLAGGINPYVFVGNNPIDGRDPGGLCPDPFGSVYGENLGINICGNDGGKEELCITRGFCDEPPSGPPIGTIPPSDGGGPVGPKTPAQAPSIAPDPRRECALAPPHPGASLLPSGSYPYPASYTYFKVNANYMYDNGGNGAWGNSVRSCLACMYSQGVAAGSAHRFCYSNADAKLPAASSALGWSTAVASAGAYMIAYPVILWDRMLKRFGWPSGHD